MDFVVRNKCFYVAIVVLAAGTSNSAVAQERAYGITSVPPTMFVGTGFDTLRSELRQDCMNATAVSTTAQRIEFEFSHISSTAQAYRSSRMAASASFNVGVWSGGAEVGRFSRSSSSRHSVRFILRMTVLNGQRRAVLPRTRRNARRSRYDREQCGNSYVSSLTTGGEFIALIEYDATNEEDAQTFAARIRGRHASGSGASAEVENLASSFSDNSRLHVRFVIRGATGPVPAETIPEVLAYARNFPATVARSGEVFGFTVSPYPVSGVDFGSSREDVIFELAEQLERVSLLREEYRLVLSEPDAYAFPSTPTSNRALDLEYARSATRSLDTAIVDIRTHARQCMDHSAPEDDCVRVDLRLESLQQVARRRADPDPQGVTGGCTRWSPDGTACVACEYTYPPGYSIPLNGTTPSVTCPSMPVGLITIRATLPNVTSPERQSTHLLQSTLRLTARTDSSTGNCGDSTPCRSHFVTGTSHNYNLGDRVESSGGNVSAVITSEHCRFPEPCSLVLGPSSVVRFSR